MQTITRNWNVNVLLGKLLLERGMRHDSRHFNQLFRQLRHSEHGALRDVVLKDLGHFDNLLGNSRKKRVKELEDVRQLVHPPSAAQEHRDRASEQERRSR